MLFSPERFSGELIIGEYHVPIEFVASADCSGCLKFDIDPICTVGNMYKFISVQSKVGKSDTLFGLRGKSQEGKTITSDHVHLVGRRTNYKKSDPSPMLDIKIGSYCTYLRMKTSQPSEQPKLAFWLPNFKSFGCPPVETNIGRVGVYGSTKSKGNNELTGLLVLQAYDSSITTNWKREAERLLMRFTSILAFARGSYLSAPVTAFCENNHVETTFYGANRGHSTGVFPPIPYLDLGPIVSATAAQIDNITDQEWNTLGKAINLMLEETNHLVSKFILEIAAFEAMAHVFLGLHKSKKRLSLRSKINGLLTNWNIDRTLIEDSVVKKLVEIRNAITHEGKAWDNNDLWDAVILAREIFARIVFSIIKFEGRYDCYVGGQHRRKFTSCEKHKC